MACVRAATRDPGPLPPLTLFSVFPLTLSPPLFRSCAWMLSLWGACAQKSLFFSPLPPPPRPPSFSPTFSPSLTILFKHNSGALTFEDKRAGSTRRGCPSPRPPPFSRNASTRGVSCCSQPTRGYAGPALETGIPIQIRQRSARRRGVRRAS